MLKEYRRKCKKFILKYQKTNEDFRHKSKVLFDNSFCKCKEIHKCTYSRNKKIPVKQESLTDQCITYIKNLDITATATKANEKKNFEESVLVQS